MILPSRRTFLRSLACVVLLAGAVLPAARAEIKPEYRMFKDPEFERPDFITTYADRLSAVWVDVLNRPEADLQRMAGESIARGHKLGVPGLAAAIPRLGELIVADSTHPSARVAAARALVSLDARDAAGTLATAAGKYSGDVRQICERALGDWKYEPIRETWRERLTATGVRHRDLVLAIRGLGLSGDPQTLPRLLELAHGTLNPPEVRLEAAQGAGRLATTGLVPEAQKLIESKLGTSIVNRMCAGRLLAAHQGPDAHAVLLKLAVDTEPAVSADALRLLNDIDSNLVLPLAADAMQSSDNLVRRQGMLAYTKLPTPERMGPVARLLDDLVPELRIEVRDTLDTLLARPELVPAIWAGVLEVLGKDSWRGQEQAALLVGAHEHKPAANRLLELQSIPRAEARVAAAWALRKVAVPETCPTILKRLEVLTKQRMGGPPLDGLDEQAGHLNEALAVMQYWQAESLWMQYVPKNPPMGHYSRATSIWALGLRFNGEHKPQLGEQLIERLTDSAPVPPELEFVRYACAITLARIQAKEQVPKMLVWVIEDNLKQGNVRTEHALAIRWAVSQLTGEKYPDLNPIPTGKQGWFLEPTTFKITETKK